MRTLSVLLASGWAVALIATSLAWGDSEFVHEHLQNPPPLHPTVLFGRYGKSEYPIVEVSGITPKVSVEGKLRSLPSSTRYAPKRGAEFAPGYIDFKKQSTTGGKTELVWRLDKGGEVSGGTLNAYSDYEAVIVPTVSCSHVYIAVMFFDAKFAKEGEGKPSVIVTFHEIGELAANQPKKVHIHFGYLGDDMNKLTFFPLVFTDGYEIRSSMSEFAATFFRRVELMRHELLVDAYEKRNAGKSAGLKPYLQIPPVFPPALDLAKLPGEVHTSFMVDTDGTVYSVEVDDKIAPDAKHAIERALRGWLFLPRMIDGTPQRTMVRVPIGLKRPEPTAAKT